MPGNCSSSFLRFWFFVFLFFSSFFFYVHVLLIFFGSFHIELTVFFIKHAYNNGKYFFQYLSKIIQKNLHIFQIFTQVTIFDSATSHFVPEQVNTTLWRMEWERSETFCVVFSLNNHRPMSCPVTSYKNDQYAISEKSYCDQNRETKEKA